MSRLAQRIAKRLKKLREEAGLTQGEVARLAGDGTESQYVSRLERAVAESPRWQELERVAKVFGMTADDLAGIPLNDDDERATEPVNDAVSPPAPSLPTAEITRAYLAEAYGPELALELTTIVKDGGFDESARGTILQLVQYMHAAEKAKRQK
jgi:transcriptional regulator with XRE-family HTH domain